MSVILVASNAVHAQEQLEIQQTQEQASPSIDDFGWIAGHWGGEAMGGSFEETWNPPMGGTMMGMFKFVQNEQVSFHEILTIVNENDAWLLRLKHFDKKLVGWEEKDESVEFPLISLSDTEAIFDGLKFLKIDQDTMHILVITKRGEESQELKFVCQRVGGSSGE